jgi:hypothetical protein
MKRMERDKSIEKIIKIYYIVSCKGHEIVYNQ